MASKTHIFKSGDTINLCASLTFPQEKIVTWKKREFTQEDIKIRKHNRLENNGFSFGIQASTPQATLSCQYTFKKEDAGKYIQFYAYVNVFELFPQTVLVFVEPQHKTDIRIREVNPKEKKGVVVGDTITCSVIYHRPQKRGTIPDNKVPQPTKDNVKWKVKIDDEKEGDFIVNGQVVRGGRISFKVPKEWHGKDIILMPYLNKWTDTIRVKINVDSCYHEDGAITVAEYIVNEIKTNTKSNIAENIRYYASYEDYIKRLEEWNKKGFLEQLITPQPEPPNLITAYFLWGAEVHGDVPLIGAGPWDHKPKIRDKFKNIAVERTEMSDITGKMTVYKSYYHKYKNYDYYYDVWSNIHYGYVGLSVGFNEQTLLVGADSAQKMDSSGRNTHDTPDDKISIQIGFMLYKKYGRYAEKLTAQDVLEALNSAKLKDSKKTHVCLQK